MPLTFVASERQGPVWGIDELKGKIAAFAAAIMLGGCALAGSPPATYDLQAPLVERVHGGGSVQLTIYPPVAVKTIDTEEILVKGANGQKTGISTSPRLAASWSISPSVAPTSRPSMISVTSRLTRTPPGFEASPARR